MFCNRQDDCRLSPFSYDQNCINSRAEQGHLTEKGYTDIINTTAGIQRGPTHVPKLWINVVPLTSGRKCSPCPLSSFFLSLSNSPLFLKNGLYPSSVILVVTLLGEEGGYKWFGKCWWTLICESFSPIPART